MHFILSVGTSGGLSLVLNVEQYYYMHGYQSSAGMQVLVSDDKEVNVLVENRGIHVPAGKHTALAVTQQRVSRVASCNWKF